MRVFLDARVMDLYPYGVGRYARELSNRLPRLAPSWEWIILRYGEERQVTERNTTTLFRKIAPNQYPVEQLKIAPIIASWQPDLVHALWFPTPESCSCPSILTLQDLTPEKGYPEHQTPRYLRWRQWYHRTCWAADFVIASSQSTKNDLLQMYGYPADRVAVNHLAASDVFQETTKTDWERAKRQYNLPDEYIFFSAHTDYSYKNLQVVPQALKILRSKGIQPPPLLSPGMEEPNDACPWVQLPFLSDSELATILGGALCMVYPSLAEGFGLPILEAMQCGTPVISSSSTSLPEVGGDAAIYFDPHSAEELADHLQLLLESPALRRDLKQKGLTQAACFSWDKCSARTLEIYQQVHEQAQTSIPKFHPYIDWKEVARLETLPPVTATPRHEGEFREHALVLLASGNREAARQALLCENATFPNSLDTLRELGKLLKMEGQYEEANAIFSDMLATARSRRLAQHIRSALFHLGECELRLDHAPAAVELLMECLELCPDHSAIPALMEEATKKAAL